MHQGDTVVPEKLPLLPLKDVVVFPQMILPVFVGEDICMKAVETALEGDKLLFLSAFRTEDAAGLLGQTDAPELRTSTPAPFDVYDVGTVAYVMRSRKLPDGRAKVLLQGVQKATVSKLLLTDSHPIVEVTPLPDAPAAQTEHDISLLARSVKDLLEKLVGMGRNISPDVLLLLEEIRDPGRLADLVASNLNLRIAEAQYVLACAKPFVRLQRVLALLKKETEATPSYSRLPAVRDDAAKSQRENYLRDQLRAIRCELGDMDAKDDLEDLREKITKAEMPPEAYQETTKQLRRLERMNQDSSEATIARTYIEWMVDLPWNKRSESTVDLQQCKKILDRDHFGLEKIKDRILEFIAVKKLNPNLRGPILCFVGPPGVGKTSLGRSIAQALGRKFVRISLGGVRDEAEVRGHRRTYVGAQPGRLVQALKNAGYKNPVMMLDELDKLGNDYKGDPSSALLEVLDPEQNHSFSDHYISVPFDLSEVIFIANANRLDTIPAPLRDRLEIIEVSGYSEEEKVEIAKSYIIPKAVTQNGLNDELVQFQETTLSAVINGYTRESGLRCLERNISTIVRKIARLVAEGDEKGKERKGVKVTPRLVKELLGEETYLSSDHDVSQPRVGVSTGLAYTSTGGEILELEVNLLDGKGGLTLTGQLGDVMKESAHTAYSFIRGSCERLGVSAEMFSHYDVHLHIPAGAVPKDGPSAGVAITMALLSAFKKQPLRQDVAMTGEISLHGKVLPVGGLREKILAALRAGIRVVLVPERNRGAIAELPLNIRRRIDIRHVSSIDDAVRECFATEHTFGGETYKSLSTSSSDAPVAAKEAN